MADGNGIVIERSDFDKIRDTLKAAAEYFHHHGHMNARLHLAAEVRYSPLASEVMAAYDRMESMRREFEEDEFYKALSEEQGDQLEPST